MIPAEFWWITLGAISGIVGWTFGGWMAERTRKRRDKK